MSRYFMGIGIKPEGTGSGPHIVEGAEFLKRRSKDLAAHVPKANNVVHRDRCTVEAA